MGDAQESMVVSSRRDADAAVIVLEGELDLHSSPELTAAVGAILAEKPATVDIDASKLAFADSAGLRALLMARNHAEKQGTTLRVSKVSEPLDRLLEMTGLREVLGVTTT